MSVSTATQKLLDAADEGIALARRMQDAGRPGDALACMALANKYSQLAKAVHDMDEAAKAYDEAAAKRGTP